MPHVAKAWHLKPHDALAIRALSQSMRISPVIAQLLVNRGVTEEADARRFLDAGMNLLHSPKLMPGMEAAVDRILDAIKDRKKICVYGDYDVDGTTGTAILVQLFQKLQVPIQFYVPNRLGEGYGLNMDALRNLHAEGVQVIISVDCGIAALEETKLASELGIEMIITDHHEMRDELPGGGAVLVHPRLPGSLYPWGSLSGSAVAFKLAWALSVRISNHDRVRPELRELLMDSLCLATLGLVADVVPLQDENRVLVKHGLKRISEQPTVGIRALLESSKLGVEQQLRAEDIAFRIAPRINAAGRLGCARSVVELLLTQCPDQARELADFLDQRNTQRQQIERRMLEQAQELAERDGEGRPALVLSHPDWHAGIIGIVAGKLVDRYGRPVILIAQHDGKPFGTGSARSIPGFEMHTALDACRDDLIAHGGHAMAAGLKIAADRIDSFRERFCEYAAQHFPQGIPPVPKLSIDAEMPLSSLTIGLLNDLDRLEPYGADNPRPLFLTGNLQLDGEPRILKDVHLKFFVRSGNSRFAAIGFYMADRLDELLSGGGKVCLVYRPKRNVWQGQTNIEMELVDFQPGPDADLA
ncbi:single-stranded-DNA-specific exonuclease RecJ [Tuwongella immobilis]|uniref:Single-stranded-DNA-specific exonuclease RecJ n=1 Tax=Tuwongella immobilis TaxID=692036 RepID=A0A6C2YLW3_9BACT|nr:single-stranded-DNA-specific exonuclease RecJ [Tuwongella immobilis]VIP02075.1 single-stranded-dna-specific exonuclease : Single-strand DNA-specific exonuclease OS=Planctomyces maris DSM 8797 GN=PM8797T_28899 PE=4 SV=1: DHH: DHHA1 [Tuwongella immobilis]VTS00312.1 single-stranded-dna-specific exonuclease : Single-strand DNA-specific exonuclease OS=Planctomyces maris DSM 8797 GN=PM8797T_28899 PE=4 SV=1: DHH: DHHA1 [Tuwongella immobilis]